MKTIKINHVPIHPDTARAEPAATGQWCVTATVAGDQRTVIAWFATRQAADRFATAIHARSENTTTAQLRDDAGITRHQ